MPCKPNKSDVDRLGERLRSGPPPEDDLRLLNEFRASFSETQEAVLHRLRHELGLRPTGRAAKSTGSIVDKLRREPSLKLSQVQDVAGCRITATDIADQDRIVETIRSAFPDARIMDRREKPSHGYRAVHIVPKIEGMRLEIQIRSLIQHRWGQLSEYWADNVDRALKYGSGPKELVEWLAMLSEFGAIREDLERTPQASREGLQEFQGRVRELFSIPPPPEPGDSGVQSDVGYRAKAIPANPPLISELRDRTDFHRPAVFLVHYNREWCAPKPRLRGFVRFDASERGRAMDERLELEIQLRRSGVDHEVVLLEAETEADVRSSHARYFESSREILQGFFGALDAEPKLSLARPNPR